MTNLYNSLPPYDEDAELSLVGSAICAAINHPDTFAEIAVTVRPDDFFNAYHQALFAALSDMVGRGIVIDHVTLPAELRRMGKFDDVGGLENVVECMNKMPSSANWAAYARTVVEHARQRRLLSACYDTIRRVHDGGGDDNLSLTLAGSLQRQAADVAGGAANGPVPFDEAVDRTLSELEAGGVACVPTDFRDFDREYRGLGRGETTVVAGRPSMGKSLLARQIAVHTALRGETVGIIAAEESVGKIVRNALAWFTGFENSRLRRGREGGQFKPAEWARVREQADRLRGLPIHVTDSIWRLDDICALSTTWKLRHDLRMLVVDDLGLIHTPAESAYQRASIVSTTLKQLYKRLEVAGVSVVQLNRGSTAREDKRPTMADLRDSGRIEEDADTILLLHREDYHHRSDPNYTPTRVAELIVAKSRDGASDVVRLQSHLATQHFTDAADELPEGL